MGKTKEQLIEQLNNVNINLKVSSTPKIQKLGIGTNYVEIKCETKQERDIYQSLLDSFQERKKYLMNRALVEKKTILEGELMRILNKENL